MRTHGIVATFETAPEIYKAAERVRDAGFREWDCIVPFPVRGLHRAMGLRRSHVPRLSLLGGVVGFTIGMLMVWFMGEVDYPLIVSGTPLFSPVFAFPIAYELTILFGVFGAMGGMFVSNLLPRFNHALFNHKDWKGFSDDKFCIVIEAMDPQYSPKVTRSFLEEIGGKNIIEVNEDE